MDPLAGTQYSAMNSHPKLPPLNPFPTEGFLRAPGDDIQRCEKAPFIAAIHRFQGLFETWLSRRCAFKRLAAATINAQTNVAVRTAKITRAGLTQTGIMS